MNLILIVGILFFIIFSENQIKLCEMHLRNYNKKTLVTNVYVYSL